MLSLGMNVEHTVVLDVLFSLTKEVVQFVQCLSQILTMLDHLLHYDQFLLFHAPDQHDLVKKLPLQAEAHLCFGKENRCDKIKHLNMFHHRSSIAFFIAWLARIMRRASQLIIKTGCKIERTWDIFSLCWFDQGWGSARSLTHTQEEERVETVNQLK